MRTLAAKQRGFTYLGLMFAVVMIGLTLTVVAQVWRTTVQRERERELLWVGHAYRMAISSYYAFGHRYPATLQDLVTDDRFPEPKHHLRKLYPDPMTGRADWTVLMTPNQSGIQGVASSSQGAPIKVDGFDLIDATFLNADCYCRWKFLYSPYRWTGIGGPVTPLGAPPAGQGGGNTLTPNGPTTAPGVLLPSDPALTPSPTTGSGTN